MKKKTNDQSQGKEERVNKHRLVIYFKCITALGMLFLSGPKLVSGQDTPWEMVDILLSEYAEKHDAPPSEEMMEWEYQMTMMKDSLGPGKKNTTSRAMINLNNTSLDELKQIPVLSIQQCLQLEHYIKTYGQLFSFYELTAIEGFDSLTIEQLKPYVFLGSISADYPITPKNLIKYGRHDLLLRYREAFPHAKGYQTTVSHENDTSLVTPAMTGYLGAPQGYLIRYRYTFTNKLMIGFSGEKDPGEEFFRGSQSQGMDHYAAFLSIQNMKWLKQLTVGTFRASFGQGLTLGGMSFGSSTGFGTSHQFFAGFRPSQSAAEYGYFQGAAVTVRTGKWFWSAFLSCVNRDATLADQDSSDSGEPLYSSLVSSGYHRTSKELEKKGAIREMIYGGNIRYLGRFFIIGLTGYYGKLYGRCEPKDALYQLFDLKGNRFGACGINTRIRMGWAQFFGELTSDANGNLAWITGITGVPVQDFSLLLAARHYPRDFQNPFATAMAQGSENQNESGIYVRMNFAMIPGINVAAFLDLFKNPWLKYRIDAPSSGTESGLMVFYQPTSLLNLGLRYTYRSSSINNSSITSGIKPITITTIHGLQFSMDLVGLLPWLQLSSKLRTRIAMPQNGGNAYGYLMSQLVKILLPRNAWLIQLQCTLFDTPEYDTRIYHYEPDVLYGFSVPAYYGKGTRTVLAIQKQLGSHFTVWGWVGLWNYTDRFVIGSGLEEVDGSWKAEVKVQLRLRI